jgi:hypothetical protein
MQGHRKVPDVKANLKDTLGQIRAEYSSLVAEIYTEGDHDW